MKLLQRLRRLFCRHVVYIEDLVRGPDGLVRSRCVHCDTVLAADCGLHLNARLARRPKL